MVGDFDPYYKWLGIPSKDQPPHYYRLLGTELFEADPEVISIAAEQRTLHVRSFQRGEYAIVSQKLQKKIAAAKACLLNPEKKAEYDISLRLQLRLQSSQSPPRPSQTPPTPPPLQEYLLESSAARPAPAQHSGTEFTLNPVVITKESLDYLRKNKWIVSLAIKLSCATVVIIIILMVFAHSKSLWTFTFDKTSNLMAKIDGSSSEKPPETRIRSAPGARRGIPASSTKKQPEGIPSTGGEEKNSISGENPGLSGNVPAPPAAVNNQASPPPAPAESGAAAGLATGNPPDTASPNNVQRQPSDIASSSTAEITSLKLPSGNIFKARFFKVNINSIADLVKEPAKDEQVLFLFHPAGHISVLASVDKSVLNGIFMTFYENFGPMTYAVYADGALDGFIKTWNIKGQRVYWCQYEKGVRNGFCCYFKENVPRMILEIDHDTISGVHLCANGELEKSFSSLEQAYEDKNAQKMLDEMEEVEAELKVNDSTFRKQIKAELQSLRREKIGAMTVPKRAAIQNRINQRIAESQELIRVLRNFYGL